MADKAGKGPKVKVKSVKAKGGAKGEAKGGAKGGKGKATRMSLRRRKASISASLLQPALPGTPDSPAAHATHAAQDTETSQPEPMDDHGKDHVVPHEP